MSWAAALLVAAGAAVVSGCGSTSVEVRPAARATEPACQAMARAWPAHVSGQSRTSTTSDSPAVAAWGAPPIIARCGVPVPGPTPADCIGADGVDWVVHRLTDGVQFTSYGRDPAIEVLVPSTYAPEPLVLSVFASAARTIPQGPHRCR